MSDSAKLALGIFAIGWGLFRLIWLVTSIAKDWREDESQMIKLYLGKLVAGGRE